MDFAFMRGDESLVRSSARLAIGVDIPTEKDLPVLIAVPARFANGEGEVPELEKGTFETYAGPLKYWKIKAWLDEVGPKIGAGKSKPGKKAATTKKTSSKKAGTKSKYSDEQIPEGGAVEWKAQKPKDQGRNLVKEAIKAREEADAAAAEAPDAPIMDESKPKKESFQGQMLDIERAGEIADEIRRKQEAASRKRKGQYVGLKADDVHADDEVTEEASSLLEKARAAVGAAMDSATQAYQDASESIGEQLEAGQVGGAVNSVREATQKVFGSASQAVKNAGESITGQLSEAAEVIGSDNPFEKKSQALMKQFEKWMAGENAGWEEELGDQFEKAQVEAEELLKRDPDEARKQAWASEEWLLREMKSDRERMMSVMTESQRAQVEGMIDLIEGRLKERGSKDVFAREEDDAGAGEADGGKQASSKHDEL